MPAGALIPMSATREQLRATVADFFGVDAGAVGPAFPLNGRQGEGSIARAALDAAIRRRVGRKATTVYTATTLGQIEAELFPDGSREVAPEPETSINVPTMPAPAPASDGPVASGGVSTGVDIESVAALPEADDYWEHSFYQATFTPAEIAYCVAQPSPRPHFASRWCAKEALRKCDRAMMGVPLNAIEVVRDASGAPALRRQVGGEWRPLPHALSLSHTHDAAVAVVVALAEIPRHSPVVETPPPPPVEAAPPPPARRGFGGMIQAALLLASLAMAALALYRTYAHG
jgi:phosphopantetheine--protein transferase-like protein